MIDKQRLHDFVSWVQQNIRGYEKGEAPIFVDRLFKALGYDGAIEAGGGYEDPIKRRRNGKEQKAFADYLISGRVLIEMKSKGENLKRHYQQVFEYWVNLVPNRPKYVILCNFDELWIYDFNTQVYDPVDMIQLVDLPDRMSALLFLLPVPGTPVFKNNMVEVTREAAQSLSSIFKLLIKPVSWRTVTLAQAQRFILQCVVTLFSEDIGLLPPALFTRIIEECQNGTAVDSYELFTLLFHEMNSTGVTQHGRMRGVDYFNGGLFTFQDKAIYLNQNELAMMHAVSQHNWASIRPAIFGTIFEQSLEAKERHKIGGHYTSETDILRIVQPVIVRPLRERIHAANGEKELRALLAELRAYRVLDPACGSGNFLYIAYREMKRLEHDILELLPEEAINKDNGFVSARQFYGLDINPFAVELAKVTLMIGKKLAVDELHTPENSLPLDNLDANIKAGDALLEPWPDFDACIGNPPYLGAKRMKVEHSVEYINRIRDLFPDVSGNADYCVYWFRKAHERMRQGARAGLVGTNTIRQNYSREGGLDYIVANDGVIFEAVSSIPWSGEAKVHVSIACWSKGDAPQTPRLWAGDEEEAREVDDINSSLSLSVDVSKAKVIKANREPKRVFQGQTPGHKGFVLSPDEARQLIKRDAKNAEVIFPYLTGDDLVGEFKSQPSRFIIDFEARTLVNARTFKAAYARVEQMVRPDREAKAKAEADKNQAILAANPRATVNKHHQQANEHWWLHFYDRSDFRQVAATLSRYVICSRISKRPIFDFISPAIRLSDKVQAFAFEDDYSFGILQSNAHWQWWTNRGATLKSDPAYTPNSVFDTFPFPQAPTPKQVKTVAEAARALHEWRRMKLIELDNLTLRDFYQTLELGGKNPLKDLHAALDKAVLAAYGFDPKADVLAQLLALNAQVAAREKAGEAVTPPAIPPDYPDPAELVSEGCIQAPALA
jgi:SAM-dependent methyltransferase